jgi:hypothetical protein
VTKLKYVGASIQNYVHKEEKIKFGEWLISFVQIL